MSEENNPKVREIKTNECSIEKLSAGHYVLTFSKPLQSTSEITSLSIDPSLLPKEPANGGMSDTVNRILLPYKDLGKDRD